MPNIFGKVKPTNGWTNLNTASTKKLWLQEFKKYKFSSSLLCLHLYQVTFRFITLVCMILNHCALHTRLEADFYFYELPTKTAY